MEELDAPHPDYIKGFNEGYTIARHMPELSRQIAQIESKSSRTQGFKDGQAQYDFERDENMHPSYLKNDRLSDIHRGDVSNDKHLDKGDMDRN